MAMKYLDLMFTDSVRRAQKQYYGRAVNIPGASQRDPLGQDEAEFIMARDSFFLGSINETGWPYIQHRGGPLGFLRVVNETTLAFADYKGNRQYITTGNLAENDRAFLFLMDYAHRRRVKLWGRARVVADDDTLVERLMPEGYEARPEQVILFEVEAWDINCPQHIPQKIDGQDVARVLGELQARIAALEEENAALRARHS